MTINFDTTTLRGTDDYVAPANVAAGAAANKMRALQDDGFSSKADQVEDDQSQFATTAGPVLPPPDMPLTPEVTSFVIENLSLAYEEQLAASTTGTTAQSQSATGVSFKMPPLDAKMDLFKMLAEAMMQLQISTNAMKATQIDIFKAAINEQIKQLKKQGDSEIARAAPAAFSRIGGEVLATAGVGRAMLKKSAAQVAQGQYQAIEKHSEKTDMLTKQLADAQSLNDADLSRFKGKHTGFEVDQHGALRKIESNPPPTNPAAAMPPDNAKPLDDAHKKVLAEYIALQDTNKSRLDTANAQLAQHALSKPQAVAGTYADKTKMMEDIDGATTEEARARLKSAGFHGLADLADRSGAMAHTYYQSNVEGSKITSGLSERLADTTAQNKNQEQAFTEKLLDTMAESRKIDQSARNSTITG